MRLIDADALMEGRDIQRGEETIGIRNFVTFEEIEAAPTIEERKTGRWIYHVSEVYPADSTQECDQCHAEQPLTCDDNYCPNCGARMEGGK